MKTTMHWTGRVYFNCRYQVIWLSKEKESLYHFNMQILARFFLFIKRAVGGFLGDASRRKQKNYEALVSEATNYLNAQNERCKTEFQIGSYARYDCDQETGKLVWSDDGVPKVIATVQFVGSISNKSNTWLWAWANPSILDSVKAEVLKLKAFGVEKRIERLVSPKWPAEEVDGWEMTALASRLLEARGAYRCPSSNGFSFQVR